MTVPFPSPYCAKHWTTSERLCFKAKWRIWPGFSYHGDTLDMVSFFSFFLQWAFVWIECFCFCFPPIFIFFLRTHFLSQLFQGHTSQFMGQEKTSNYVFPHAPTYLALFNHFFYFEVYHIYLANSYIYWIFNPSEFFSISIVNFRAYLTYFSSIQRSVSLVFNISSWIEDSSITMYMLSLLISDDSNSPLQSMKTSLLVPITNHFKLFLI